MSALYLGGMEQTMDETIVRLMNEAERLQADLASARRAINLLNERQRVEWARADSISPSGQTTDAHEADMNPALRCQGSTSQVESRPLEAAPSDSS